MRNYKRIDALVVLATSASLVISGILLERHS